MPNSQNCGAPHFISSINIQHHWTVRFHKSWCLGSSPKFVPQKNCFEEHCGSCNWESQWETGFGAVCDGTQNVKRYGYFFRWPCFSNGGWLKYIHMMIRTCSVMIVFLLKMYNCHFGQILQSFALHHIYYFETKKHCLKYTLIFASIYFHTSTFTLSHFHTFTLSHFQTFTLSNFHSFTLSLFNFYTFTFRPGESGPSWVRSLLWQPAVWCSWEASFYQVSSSPRSWTSWTSSSSSQSWSWS